MSIGPSLLERLAPICRSITGDGVRQTMAIIAEHLPISTVEVPSGTPVLDWHVPDEWNLAGAYIADADGNRLVDAADSWLHVVSYSDPVDCTMGFDELRPHLHTLADRPDVIPYRTSYWNRDWGFCLEHDRLAAIEAAKGPLHVVVDATLAPGALTYGQLLLPGSSDREVILTTHVCHPTMVNDNVSGIAAMIEIGRRLAAVEGRRLSVRLLFVPGTIGSITWLADHLDAAAKVEGGLVLTGLGDASPLTYKSSRRSDTRMDRTARKVIAGRDSGARFLPWDPYGYDERQFCSPGVDLPVGRLTRGVHGTYPEYHTSADDLEFVSAERIDAAVDAVMDILASLDSDPVVVSRNPVGEPQLGRRGLYRPIAGDVNGKSVEMATLWVLSLADGQHGVRHIAERSGLPVEVVQNSIDRLRAVDLVEVL